MKKYVNPSNWSDLTERPLLNQKDLSSLINEVFENVKTNGDQSLKDYAFKFDNCKLESIEVSDDEILQSSTKLNDNLKAAIKVAYSNIYKFHQAQKRKEDLIETMNGVNCWRESRAIEKVGLYIPGGTAPLFSTILMLAIPAKIAGCKEVVLCTPPNSKGEINDAILFTANLVGVTKIFKAGGAQAIAAMGFGTETIPQVYKIFGPGNQYVTKAKETIQNYGVAIDMPAGPSEVLIISDRTSNPEFVAADLLSQAEHGSDSQVILLSDSAENLNTCLSALERQVEKLPRKEFAKQALVNSKAIVLSSLDECFEFSNEYGPEHLILAFDSAKNYLKKIENAGSVFVGKYSCESAGDYASGTNHTLPTNGYAKNYSGVSLDSFVKKITFQELSAEGILNIGPSIELMAEAEELFAHKNAVTLRLNELKK